jgi:hypothetical protein
MCPFCLATLGLVLAGAASGGGLAAVLAAKAAQPKNESREITQSREKSRCPIA